MTRAEQYIERKTITILAAGISDYVETDHLDPRHAKTACEIAWMERELLRCENKLLKYSDDNPKYYKTKDRMKFLESQIKAKEEQ